MKLGQYQGRRLPADLAARIVPMYEAGHSRFAIAQELGIAHITVTKRLQAAGIAPTNRVLRMEDHPRWSGGRETDRDGYVRVRVPVTHRFASMRNIQGSVAEHRLVMAEHLGRPLLRSETVHHLNGASPASTTALERRRPAARSSTSTPTPSFPFAASITGPMTPTK